MSSTRRKISQHPVITNIGCGCRRPKLSNIFTPKPKTKPSNHPKHPHQPRSNSSISSKKAHLSIQDHNHNSTSPHRFKNPKPLKSSSRVSESVAVVKDSDDPYLDFRHSMLQMILEKEIYGRDDLRELLDCFLSLNSPYHHEIIVQAFSEIWNGVYSAPNTHRRWRSRDSEGIARGEYTRHVGALWGQNVVAGFKNDVGI
ncbi:transcription repressor OFP6-like [Magnolia sinica]|uniref:transcription repressor OFP6-like n=1 Tax=Magnolia sinica TaxID=86752 RepID=UPI00265ADCE2|nr:transcription repressor OFP6-like [Magnolia sinica]